MSKVSRPTQRTRLTPQQRQKDIIHAARKVFEARGYEAWTVADVAEEVGVVEGTVLHYFKSKNNLIAKVIEEFYSDITQDMEQGVKGITGMRNQLRFVIYKHTLTLIENTDLCSLMLKVARESNRELGAQIYELSKRYTKVVLDIIEAGKKTGEVAENVSTRLVRHVLFGAMEHFLWDLIHGRRDVDAGIVAEELTELVYSGIATKPKNLNPEIGRLVLRLNELMT